MTNSILSDEWTVIKDLSTLEVAEQKSYEKPVFIFKHSTRCGISAHGMFELEQWHQNNREKVDVFFLDLLSFRPISNLIAERYKIPHQSPQLIGLVNGEGVHAISHSSINENDINFFYRKMLPLAEGHIN